MDYRRVSNKRLMLWGDRERAASHIGEGNSLLHICQLQAGFQELDHFQLVRNLEDGSRIIARIYAGLSDVIITSPFVPKPVLEPVVELEILPVPAVFTLCYGYTAFANSGLSDARIAAFNLEYDTVLKVFDSSDHAEIKSSHTIWPDSTEERNSIKQMTAFGSKVFFWTWDVSTKYFYISHYSGLEPNFVKGFANILLCGFDANNPGASSWSKSIPISELVGPDGPDGPEGEYDDDGNPKYHRIAALFNELAVNEDYLLVRKMDTYNDPVELPEAQKMAWDFYTHDGDFIPEKRIMFTPRNSNMWFDNLWWANIIGSNLYFGMNFNYWNHYVQAIDVETGAEIYSADLPASDGNEVFVAGAWDGEVIYGAYLLDSSPTSSAWLATPGGAAGYALQDSARDLDILSASVSDKFLYSGHWGGYVYTINTVDGFSFKGVVKLLDLLKDDFNSSPTLAGIVPWKMTVGEILADESKGLESRLFEAVNNERDIAGLPTLGRIGTGSIYDSAKNHSEYMVTVTQAPNHDNVESRYDLIKAEYPSWFVLAENTQYHSEHTSGFVDLVIQSWMDSPGHKENILREGLQYSALAIYISGDNRVGITQLFWGLTT